jgi:hypothetical protein
MVDDQTWALLCLTLLHHTIEFRVLHCSLSSLPLVSPTIADVLDGALVCLQDVFRPVIFAAANMCPSG